MSLRIPKLRTGSYFPEWLLEPRRRSERALLSVVAEAYVLGVSTRRVERLMETMGLTIEQAMAALKVPEGERQKYMDLLERQ